MRKAPALVSPTAANRLDRGAIWWLATALTALLFGCGSSSQAQKDSFTLSAPGGPAGGGARSMSGDADPEFESESSDFDSSESDFDSGDVEEPARISRAKRVKQARRKKLRRKQAQKKRRRQQARRKKLRRTRRARARRRQRARRAKMQRARTARERNDEQSQAPSADGELVALADTADSEPEAGIAGGTPTEGAGVADGEAGDDLADDDAAAAFTVEDDAVAESTVEESGGRSWVPVAALGGGAAILLGIGLFLRRKRTLV